MKKISIGKVSQISDLPQSVIRYWETVFDSLDPEKSDGGTRRYSQEDVDLILEIKDLLYKRKFTIAGAQTALHNRSTSNGVVPEDMSLVEIVSELDDIINQLSER